MTYVFLPYLLCPLTGIEEKGDYLAGLGIEAVWLSPFYKSPGVDNGYDVSDFRNIETKYGTMADFENMLKTLRKKYGKLDIASCSRLYY